MPTKKKIITFTVLGLISMGLGYWYGMPKGGSGGGGGNGGGGKKEPAFLKQGLVAYYPFNGNAKDESGNGNDGEVNGATLAADRHGIEGCAFGFDGKKSFIRLPVTETLNFNADDFAITTWLKFGEQLNKRRSGSIIHALTDEGGGYKGVVVFVIGLRKGIQFRLDYDEKLYLTEHPSLFDLTWRQFVFQKSGNIISIHINGKVSATREVTNLDYKESVSQMILGCHGNVQPGQESLIQHYEGRMDDIRIYNRALSEAEVKALYEFEKPKTQQASTPTSTKVVPQKLIADPIVEKAVRERRRKPTGELTKADLERVVYLDLTSTKITDASLKEVAKLTQLKSLYLNDTKITDVGLREVAEMKQLTSLYFKDTQITDEGLEEVAKMKQLTTLDLRATKVTKAVVRQLQKTLPKCKIYSNAKK